MSLVEPDRGDPIEDRQEIAHLARQVEASGGPAESGLGHGRPIGEAQECNHRTVSREFLQPSRPVGFQDGDVPDRHDARRCVGEIGDRLGREASRIAAASTKVVLSS